MSDIFGGESNTITSLTSTIELLCIESNGHKLEDKVAIQIW
ncbi:hypothetical protein EmuJ_000093500 [Echinococcus multilocularis]|uniref:Uncharacterized protein n=1 Tax=Echinococcus multilocularis TaxID=6211 RepID=A0A087VXZ5_ECHMU|nr:hypothetical protein EmuJ_000093500 [Echinococcus multilocularis]